MKTIIRDVYFEKSTLAAHFQIDVHRREGERLFELSLTSGKDMVNIVTKCTGTLFDDDLKYLCAGLEKLAGGERVPLSFAPMDPLFLLRGQVLKDGSVELLWVVDHGMKEASYSTDTGVGILMNVNTEALINASKDFRGYID